MRIYLSDFDGRDARERIANALECAKRDPGSTLVIEPGEYVIGDELSRRTMREAISGAYGENPEKTMFSADFPFSVGMSLEGHRGTKVSAYGAVFMIDGFMEPVCLKNCSDITVEGLRIDHVRKPYSRGIITRYDTAGKTMTVSFDAATPADEKTIMPRMCIYDHRTGMFRTQIRAESRMYAGGGTFVFGMDVMPDDDMTGQEFYVWHSFHFRPGILIEEAKNIRLADVEINSQPGMGIVGHRSEDIYIERLKIRPSHGQNMSVNTDATHFTSCKGTLMIKDSVFRGQGDDCTNVHTFYHDIEPDAANECAYTGSVSVPTHSVTLDLPDKGDRMELVDIRSLEKIAVYTVLDVVRDPDGKRYHALLDAPLPEGAGEKCRIADVTRSPQLIFTGCECENHWARSVLVKCRRALIENCTFRHSDLQAVHVAAEGWWHEGVTCEEIAIRRCRFTDCGMLKKPRAGGIIVEIDADELRGFGQKNITIEENIFDLHGPENAIWIRNASGIKIRDNVFTGDVRGISVADSENVDIG